MRLSRLAVLAVALSAPLRAQDVTPATPTSFSAKLHFTSYADMWFESNRPAYFAVFELTHDYLVQLYPASPYERTRLAGSGTGGYSREATTYGRPDIYMAQRAILGSGLYRYAVNAGRFSDAQMHTLLLVSSTRPLAIGMPADAFRLQTELGRLGHSFDLDRESAITALINLITPDASDDEVAVDLIPVMPSQLWYPVSAFDASYGNLYCRNDFHSVYFWTPWQFSESFCNPFYLNPWFRPTKYGPGTPPVPTTRATEEIVAMPLKLLNDGHSTSNPEEIRRIIDQLKDYDAARGYGTPARVAGMGGAEVNYRQTVGDSRRTLGSPATDARNANGSQFSGTSNTPADIHRGTPGPTSSGRTLGGVTPNTADRNSGGSASTHDRAGDDGFRSRPTPQYRTPAQPAGETRQTPQSGRSGTEQRSEPRSEPRSAPQAHSAPAPTAAPSTPPPARSDVSKPAAKP